MGWVFAGLLGVILIGLIVEGVLFRWVENRTVRRWGMQTACFHFQIGRASESKAQKGGREGKGGRQSAGMIQEWNEMKPRKTPSGRYGFPSGWPRWPMGRYGAPGLRAASCAA